MNEFTQSFLTPTSPTASKHPLPKSRRSALLENKLKEFEIEMERLSSRSGSCYDLFAKFVPKNDLTFA
jgi:hypothetical protein